MFVLAHLSDLHMALRPRLLELAGKRGLGYINWRRGRKYIHRRETLDAITRDLKTAGADHIAVTGDLVNLSLPIEYAAARAWLETLGPPHDVTVIPGNHDAYVPAALGGPEKAWGDYMRGDDGAPSGTFPFVRRRDGVALIALSSALPTGPFMATGLVGEATACALCPGARANQADCSAWCSFIIRRRARRAGICGDWSTARNFAKCSRRTAPISSCTVTIIAARSFGWTDRTRKFRRSVRLRPRRARRIAMRMPPAITFFRS